MWDHARVESTLHLVHLSLGTMKNSQALQSLVADGLEWPALPLLCIVLSPCYRHTGQQRDPQYPL